MLAALVVAAFPTRLAAQSIAIVNANVVDVRAGQVRPRSTVLVDRGRITRVAPGDSVTVPPEARRIDAAGAYLIPGLADMHAHFARPEDLRVFLAYGVTLVQYLNAFPELL